MTFKITPHKKIQKVIFLKINGKKILLKSFKHLQPHAAKEIKPHTTDLKQIIVLQFNQNGGEIDLQQFPKS